MGKEAEKSGSEPEFFSTQVLEARRFYLERSGGGKPSLAVVCGGCEECTYDYEINRADFPYYSIEFVARGKGFLILAGKEYPLRPGVVFSYGPGISQRIYTDAQDRLVKYFVDFTGAKGARLLEKFGPAPGSVVQVANPEAILRIFDDLIDNGLAGSRYSALICTTLVEHMILKIAETTTSEDAHTSAAFGTYQTCRQFIQTHCLALKTLDEIACSCRVAPSYLCRLFSRFDHQSPYQYLMRLKMNIAAERLQAPNALVKQVTYELGFKDPFHFSKAFKKIFGLSPSSFRRLR